MAFNLSRNSRVFVTTNLNTATGAVLTSSLSTENCWEIQVLDGFSFSQTAENNTISLNEAGDTPVRGQRTFNTALAPVEISFSTYIRPRLTTAPAPLNNTTAEERVLWNALMGTVGIDGTAQAGSTLTAIASSGTVGTITRSSTTVAAATITSALTLTPAPSAADMAAGKAIYHLKGATTTGALPWYGPVSITSYVAGTSVGFTYLSAPAASAGTVSPVMTGLKFDRAAWCEYLTCAAVASTAAAAVLTAANSNKNQLQTIGFIFLVDNIAYTIDNCVMDQAVIDFGLDGIAMVAWTAKGTRLVQQSVAPSISAANPAVFTGSMTGSAVGKVVDAHYITNKLSTVTLQSNIGGLTGATSSTAYTVALTAGSITYANNVTYVTPANIGTVNVPIGYFTGARAISGTLSAYLRTGTNTTATLLDDLLDKVSAGGVDAAETKYRLQIEIGGASAGTRVEVDLVGASISIPSVDVQDVISTEISFNAQSTGNILVGNTYDLENTNDVTIRYYSI